MARGFLVIVGNRQWCSCDVTKFFTTAMRSLNKVLKETSGYEGQVRYDTKLTAVTCFKELFQREVNGINHDKSHVSRSRAEIRTREPLE
jgi:hypothetical protein